MAADVIGQWRDATAVPQDQQATNENRLVSLPKTEFDAAAFDAMLETMTTAQIGQLDRLQGAQIIVMKKVNPLGADEVLHVCAATQMAMANDMTAPVETIVDNALRILGCNSSSCSRNRGLA